MNFDICLIGGAGEKWEKIRSCALNYVETQMSKNAYIATLKKVLLS
jgi:hypothetical protein